MHPALLQSTHLPLGSRSRKRHHLPDRIKERCSGLRCAQKPSLKDDTPLSQTQGNTQEGGGDTGISYARRSCRISPSRCTRNAGKYCGTAWMRRRQIRSAASSRLRHPQGQVRGPGCVGQRRAIAVRCNNETNHSAPTSSPTVQNFQ